MVSIHLLSGAMSTPPSISVPTIPVPHGGYYREKTTRAPLSSTYVPAAIKRTSSTKSLSVSSTTSFLSSTMAKGIKGTKNGILSMLKKGASNIGYNNSHARRNCREKSEQDCPSLCPTNTSRIMVENDGDEGDDDDDDDYVDNDNVSCVSSGDLHSPSCQKGSDIGHFTGHLYKWINYARGYRRRFFVINPAGQTFSYYKSCKEYPHKPRMTVPISSIQSIQYPDPSDPLRFHLSINVSRFDYAPASNDINNGNDYSTGSVCAKALDSASFTRTNDIPHQNIFTLHLLAESMDQAREWMSLLEKIKMKKLNISPSSYAAHSPSSQSALFILNEMLMMAGNSDSTNGNSQWSDCMIKVPASKILLLQQTCTRERSFFLDRIRSLEERLRWLAIEERIGEPKTNENTLSKTTTSHNANNTPTTANMAHTESAYPNSSASIYDSSEDDSAMLALSSDECDEFFDVMDTCPSIVAKSAHSKSIGPSSLEPLSPCQAMCNGESSMRNILQKDNGASFCDRLKKASLGYPPAPRQKLSANARVDLSAVSVWTVLKNAIGKDITRLSVPIQFNEPLSMLQRVAEEMEYAHLLDAAATLSDDAGKRLLYVAAFAVSSYSSTADGRLTKPFNPLLYETFELVSTKREEMAHGDTVQVSEDQAADQELPPGSSSFFYLSEQVSHHPPISAAHAEGERWTLDSETIVKMSFWGKSISLCPGGRTVLSLTLNEENDAPFAEDNLPKNFDGHLSDKGRSHKGASREVYSWKKVTTNVNNVIVGRMWIGHTGEMTITNHSTGHHARIVFGGSNTGDRASLLSSWLRGGSSASSLTNGVHGHVFDPSGSPLYSIDGTWSHSLTATPVPQTFNDNKDANGTRDSDGINLSDAANNSMRTVPSDATSTISGASGIGALACSDAADDGGSFLLWMANKRPPWSPEMFHFTKMAMSLNEITPSLKCHIANTDSRRRPDQRALEGGCLSDGILYKEQLEIQQRRNASVLKQRTCPMWFRKHGGHSKLEESNVILPAWTYVGGYWECRESGNWPCHTPAIFLEDNRGKQRTNNKQLE